MTIILSCSSFISRIPDVPPPPPMIVVIEDGTRLATYYASNRIQRDTLVVDYSGTDYDPPPSGDCISVEREGNS